jgi:hypothetical protein
MVRLFLRLVMLCLLAAAVWWGWRHFFTGEEARIRSMLADLSEVVSVPTKESAFQTLASANGIQNHLLPEIVVNVDVPEMGHKEFSERTELMQAYMAARTLMPGLKVELLDPQIKVASDRRSATVEVTLKATQPGKKDLLAQEIHMTLQKPDKNWRVSRVETVQVLRK